MVSKWRQLVRRRQRPKGPNRWGGWCIGCGCRRRSPEEFTNCCPRTETRQITRDILLSDWMPMLFCLFLPCFPCFLVGGHHALSRVKVWEFESLRQFSCEVVRSEYILLENNAVWTLYKFIIIRLIRHSTPLPSVTHVRRREHPKFSAAEWI